jgi:hypothetical protein
MLRHIISVSLAMTACATLIPTKANAATLTLTPVGSLQRNPGDSIEFILTLNPEIPLVENWSRNPKLFFDYDGMSYLLSLLS